MKQGNDIKVICDWSSLIRDVSEDAEIYPEDARLGVFVGLRNLLFCGTSFIYDSRAEIGNHNLGNNKLGPFVSGRGQLLIF